MQQEAETPGEFPAPAAICKLPGRPAGCKFPGDRRLECPGLSAGEGPAACSQQK
jgi:hypothetical protein